MIRSIEPDLIGKIERSNLLIAAPIGAFGAFAFIGIYNIMGGTNFVRQLITGLPVAPILAEGPDYFVTPDLGVTLRALMSDTGASDDRRAAFQAAGRALAALHAQGFSHGRPAVRDLCWDGAEVRFIDMERFSPRHQSPRHFAADIFVFVHSVFAAGGGEAELENALTAYRNAGGPLQASIALARRLRWIGPVARGLRRLKPHSRELMALEPTLAYIASAR